MGWPRTFCSTSSAVALCNARDNPPLLFVSLNPLCSSRSPVSPDASRPPILLCHSAPADAALPVLVAALTSWGVRPSRGTRHLAECAVDVQEKVEVEGDVQGEGIDVRGDSKIWPWR